jgi:hypothetical protein
MVRGPRHASWQSMRNCMGGVRWLVDGYGCGGQGATPTVREGEGRVWGCALGPEVGGRQYVFPFTSRGELVGGLRCRSGCYSHKRAGMAT